MNARSQLEVIFYSTTDCTVHVQQTNLGGKKKSNKNPFSNERQMVASYHMPSGISETEF